MLTRFCVNTEKKRPRSLWLRASRHHNMCLLIIEYGVNHFHLIHPGRIIFGSFHRCPALRACFVRSVCLEPADGTFIFILLEKMGMPDPMNRFLHSAPPYYLDFYFYYHCLQSPSGSNTNAPKTNDSNSINLNNSKERANHYPKKT